MARQGWSKADEQAASRAAGGTVDPNNPNKVTESTYTTGGYGDEKLDVTTDYATGEKTYGPRGDQKELARYRSMADAAAARKAYQVDFSRAQADRADGLRARGDQTDALRLQRQAAMGNAPSRAAIMGNQMAGQSLDATLGASAGSRGLGAAAAQSMAMRGQTGMQLGGVQQMAGMRSQEMLDARNQYGAGATGIRAGDYASQALSQQQAEAQAQAENAQRRLNDGAQLGYEQAGLNVEQSMLDASTRMAQAQNVENQTTRDANDARNARYQRVAVSGMTAVGGALSDETTKQGVTSLYEAPGTEKHWDRDVTRQPDVTSGASLSGPTPKYGTGGGFAAAHSSKQGGPRKMTPEELKRLGDEMLGAQQEKTRASLDAGPTVKDRGDSMGKALADMQPYEYEYKPEFGGDEGQRPGEKNVGPMAQDMAKNPITGSAVIRRPDGMLAVDMTKAGKLSLGAIGYLAAKQREQSDEIERLKKGRA